jgi:two-component system, sensor histidine kinase and response regulator
MLTGLNILLAEDDKLNQKIVNYILLKKGASIEMALDGNMAIQLLLQHKFDLILMDIQMPVMDGYAAASYIRTKMNLHIPIIAFTADPFAHQSVKYKESGINACISKPIDPNNLCDLIYKLTIGKKETITSK